MNREEWIGSIPEFDEAAARRARARLDILTKPPGSLGRLETLAADLCGITGKDRPRFRKKAVLVFAADHGVSEEGVSAYPAEVTPQMVLNFLSGGAAINVLARQAGAEVFVADMGVNRRGVSFPEDPHLIRVPLGPGTQNFAKGPAMTPDQAARCVEAGRRIALDRIADGFDLLAVGDMGIGNSTSAAAITAVRTGRSPEETTGRGTGVDDATWKRKVEVIRKSIAFHWPEIPEASGASSAPPVPDGLDVLGKIGGFEIGGIAGACLAGASRRVPVVVDGFISTAGALIAAALCPRARRFWIPSHLSRESGHRSAVEHLGFQPYLDMNLRLGEGTGAALTFHLIEAAARILDEMATFEEAGVSEKTSSS